MDIQDSKVLLLNYVLLLKMLSPCAANAQFLEEPVSVTVAEGLEAVFECQYQVEEGLEVTYQWAIDDTLVNVDSPTVRARPPSSISEPTTLTILATQENNNSVIQCGVDVRDGLFSVGSNVSTIATFVVQETVITVIINAVNIISLTWSAVPHTEYCVNINKTTVNSFETVTLDPVCGVTDSFNVTYPDHSVCDRFSFTVTPTDGGRRGTTSQPESGFFTRAQGSGGDDLVSESGAAKSVKFVFYTAPKCTIFTFYQVVSNLLSTPFNQPITDPSLFNGSLVFSLPTDKKGEYTITLTDVNGIELVFENIPITTFDIQDLLVSECPGGGINVSIVYVEGTLSPGALVCVLPRTNCDLDFTNMKLVFIPQSKSVNFTIPVPSGEYRVIAFDLESGTIPRLPISIAADSEDIFLISSIEETSSPPPSSEDITVTVLSSEDVQVTCPQPLNCLVLIQSLTSLNILLVRFIESFITSAIFSLDTVSNDSYVVMYSWDNEQSIFDGKVSLISSLDLPTIIPTSVSPTNPPPGTVSQAPLPTEAVAGISVIGIILLLILIVCVGTTVIVIVRIRKQQYKVDFPEDDGRVDWSSMLAGIEQPNEAYAISAMMKKNIAYEETKTGAQRQRMDDSPVLTVTEGGEYENIQPVHQYEEVLPQSQTNTTQYVN